jgi:uncharacterized protein (DUF39 family)
VATRFVLKGARGYVAGVGTSEWTPNAFHAHQWVTAEAAHRAARAHQANTGERLAVVIQTNRYPYMPAA